MRHYEARLGGNTHAYLTPASKLPLCWELDLPYPVGESALLALGLAAASSSEDPRPRLAESLSRAPNESVEEALGLFAAMVPGSDPFASARL